MLSPMNQPFAFLADPGVSSNVALWIGAYALLRLIVELALLVVRRGRRAYHLINLLGCGVLLFAMGFVELMALGNGLCETDCESDAAAALGQWIGIAIGLVIHGVFLVAARAARLSEPRDPPAAVAADAPPRSVPDPPGSVGPPPS